MPFEQVSVENLERGYSGTAHTVDKMHALVVAGKLDQTIQKIANWIRLGVRGDHFGSSKAVADAIFWWVKRHGIFQRDPFQVEKIENLLSSMRPVIEARRAGKYDGPAVFQGDCDQFSLFVAALGGILGFQYRFTTARTDDSRPDEFSHIWTELLVDNEWYPLDASTPSAYPGWRPPVSKDRMEDWPEKNIEEVSMRGLGRYGMGEENGQPKDDGWSAQRYLYHPDPALNVDLAPDQPARSFGDETKMSEEFQKFPTRRPDQRDGLIMSEADVPRYPNWGAEMPTNAVELSTPYPYNWPWARQVEVVDPGVVGLNGLSRRFRGAMRSHPREDSGDTAWARSRRTANPFRGAMRSHPRAAGSAGMGQEPKDNYNYNGTPTTPPTTPSEATQDSLTKTIFEAINGVAKVYGTVTTAQADAEKAKYAATVANAISNVGGTPRPPSPPSSPYTLPLLIGGGAVTVGLIAYFLSK